MVSRIVVALMLLSAAALPASAQDVRSGGRPRDAASTGESRPAPPRPMPPEAVTRHTVELPGRALKFTAAAGAFRLGPSEGAPLADIGYIAYTLDGAEPGSRPVTFAFNGGPGASSAWLHLGAMGPWRVTMDAAAPGPHAAGPNAETWLDFTDMVFVDPAGTGLSRLLQDSEEGRRKIWSVDGDIGSLTEVMRRWLERAHRMASPKYIVGESYGGFRGPRLVRQMHIGEGIGIDGLILVSPMLDYGGRSASLDPLTWATRLPSMTASARERAGATVTQESQADVEHYAAGEFVTDFLRGERDGDALDRIAARVAAFTQLDPAQVRARGGRIDWTMVLRRDPNRIGGVYDSTITGPNPFPLNPYSYPSDPIADGLRATMTTAMLELYGGRLNWLPEGRYEVLNGNVGRQWDYGRNNTRPDSVNALRADLALDPKLRVLVLHGFNDLATPYFMTKLELDQIAPAVAGDRLKLVVLPGGHMMYIRDASRQALREEAARLFAR